MFDNTLESNSTFWCKTTYFKIAYYVMKYCEKEIKYIYQKRIISGKTSKHEKVWYLLMSLNVLTINIPLFAIFFVMVKRRALWMSRKNVELNVKCSSTLLRSFLYLDLLTCAPNIATFHFFYLNFDKHLILLNPTI